MLDSIEIFGRDRRLPFFMNIYTFFFSIFISINSFIYFTTIGDSGHSTPNPPPLKPILLNLKNPNFSQIHEFASFRFRNLYVCVLYCILFIIKHFD